MEKTATIRQQQQNRPRKALDLLQSKANLAGHPPVPEGVGQVQQRPQAAEYRCKREGRMRSRLAKKKISIKRD